MIRINLLPVREARRKANLRQQALMLGAAVGGALVVCLVLHTAIAAQISGEETRIAEAQVELKKLEDTLQEVERYRKEKEDIEAKLEVIARLEKNRQGPVRIMDEIATRTPERLWLSDLKLNDGVLEMKGTSTDNEVIAAFMTSLSESPFLSQVELQETNLKDSKGLKVNEFKITCRETASLRPQAAADGSKGKGKVKAKGRSKARGAAKKPAPAAE